MKPELIQLNSSRAKAARLSRLIGKNGYYMLLLVSLLALIGAIIAGITASWHVAALIGAVCLIFYLPAVWWKRELSILSVGHNQSISNRLSVDILARLKPGEPLDPQTIWVAIGDHWQANFFINHLLLSQELIASHLGTEEAETSQALQAAAELADHNQSEIIELGYLAAGLMLASPGVKNMLTRIKAQPTDIMAIANWFGRALADEHRPKPYFGGIGRDWAFGFTPLLNRFGNNLSHGIMKYGAHFGWLMDSAGVKAIEVGFSNHTNAIALIGPDGIGKTSSVYALAQRLIEGKTDRVLAYHQVVSLNATDITSRARAAGDLERIMISLINEAAHAENIILFFDDAQLFLGRGPGSFDGTQILLSVIQARVVPIIMAFTPNDFQSLRTQNQSLASLLTPVVLQEQPESAVMSILEDTALSLEKRHQILVAYEALRETYRLSGRFDQDEAYPGKAIKLLQQAVNHPDHSIISALSVQQAIEQTRGVKVGSVAPAEADALLHLEDNIHKRMINQSHAVNVVANALRRARAGVSSPNRPIGSFLFLGPTGVGKTELAKSIAATYFGSESNMIRLDMSEYQQPDDVQRLLSSEGRQASSLMMSIRQQPFSVVLLDEIEKAHPNVLNLLLQMLDEGHLTDIAGRRVSFKDAIIITTSNAGANEIRERVGHGESLDSFSNLLIEELIHSGQFRPELLNRFDETVLFRPLTPEELGQVVLLMLADVNRTLMSQNISVALTAAAVATIVAAGNDPRLGARPMRRTLQRAVEDTLARKILTGEVRPGDHIALDAHDLVI